MAIEDKLKNYILTKYNSCHEFTQEIGMPYSTFRSILNRGIENASVVNILKICSALGISADALADGNIVPMAVKEKTILSVENIIDLAKYQIMNADQITLAGNILNEEQIRSCILALDLMLEMEKKRQATS